MVASRIFLVDPLFKVHNAVNALDVAIDRTANERVRLTVANTNVLTAYDRVSHRRWRTLKRIERLGDLSGWIFNIVHYHIVG